MGIFNNFPKSTPEPEEFDNDQNENFEDGRETKKNHYSDDKSFIIKILLPIDSYGTEYKLFFIGKNNTLVANYKYAQVFEDFNDAKEISDIIVDSYKNLGIWVPSKITARRVYN